MKVSARCVVGSFAVSLVCTVSNPDEVVESLLLACQHCRMLPPVLEATVLQRFSSGRSDLVTSVSYYTIHPFSRCHSTLSNHTDRMEGTFTPFFFYYCSLLLNNWKYEVILPCRIFCLQGNITVKMASYGLYDFILNQTEFIYSHRRIFHMHF